MKINAALIGSGNIGTDLMMKALRSEWIKPVWMAGIDADSDGLAKAREHGIKTTHEGVDGLLPHMIDDTIQIDRDSLVMGYAGVYSSFLLHAKRAAEKHGVASEKILVEPGRMKTVGGQEDMIEDVALNMARRN